MRTGPGTSYPRIATLDAGTGVNVARCAGSWCRVRVGRLSGWVSSGYLQGLSRPPVVVRPPVIVRPPVVVRPPHYRPRPPHHRPRPRPDCRIAPGYPCR
ncbi:SH3 domain-containing protein [Agaricicola taiwanensis]|uniref:SH3 domain-containing protein n=1 Tax=Agaricicola taiwanensis TaxID=591372 RepID=UPI003530905E